MVTPGGNAPTGPGRDYWLLHVDLDQFQAAVEYRRRPELRGRPVVVGGTGDPTQPRKVVTCASYEAREYGVHAGTPLRAAARRCPDAVFLPLDAPAYDAASAEVMDTLRSFPVLVEVWGWDEAVLGARTTEPIALAREIQRAVAAATGLSCSIGVGDTKPRAKTATGFAKPAGVHRLTAETWLDQLGERSTEALWGIGRKTARKLADHDLHTVADLAAADPAELAGWFGPTIGPGLRRIGRGEGSTRIVTEPWEPRSRSRQTTYPADLSTEAEVRPALAELAIGLATEVFGEGRVAVRVAVTVRTASFFTRTRSVTLEAPTTDPAEVELAAQLVLGRFELDRPVRLLGVRVDFP